MFPKLNLVCSKDEIRPAITHVQVTRKDCRATDGHALVILPTSALFNPEKIALLPDHPIYVKHDNWKEFTVSGIAEVLIEASSFVVVYKGAKSNKIIPFKSIDERFPDFDAIMPRWDDGESLGEISMNPSLAQNVFEALTYPKSKNTQLVFKFTGARRAIMCWVQGEGSACGKAIVMPNVIKESEGYKYF